MPTSDQLTSWWQKTPQANVALVLGRGRFAVDLDGGETAEALLADAGIALPPDAPRSRTGSGYHVFLGSYNPIPDRVGLLTTGGAKPQVDIRGVGIVVAPPSIHPTGAHYEWITPLRADLPRAPQALLGLIAQAPSAAPQEPQTGKQGRFWVADALRGVGEGQRDGVCTQLAGYLLGKNIDADTTTALLCASFARNCTPPFDPRDVEKCVRSIARRHSVTETDRGVGTVHIADLLIELETSMKAGPAPMLTTPFRTLNEYLGGGFSPGELIFLGARPGVGKTALGLEFSRHAAAHGSGSLFISREMKNLALARRLVAQDGRIRARALKRGELTAVEWHNFRESTERLSPRPMLFTDEAVSLSEVQMIVESAIQEGPLGLLVVDYLQLIRTSRDIKERRHQVEAVSQGLKTMAMQYGLPVLCLSSLSRSSEADREKPPTLASLRESGELEHDADVILLLHRKYREETTSCVVAKNRDGRIGEVKLLFRAEFVAFDQATFQDEA